MGFSFPTHVVFYSNQLAQSTKQMGFSDSGNPRSHGDVDQMTLLLGHAFLHAVSSISVHRSSNRWQCTCDNPPRCCVQTQDQITQSVGMGVRVCKPVCIEEKISGQEVADYVASKERNATPNSCDQQPPVHLFSPLYTRTYIHEPPFRHSASDSGKTPSRQTEHVQSH